MSKPTPTTLREILGSLDEKYSLWAKSDTTYMQHDLAEATQSIKEQLKALLPEKKQQKFMLENPMFMQNDEDRCRFYRYGGHDFAIDQIQKAIEEWAK